MLDFTETKKKSRELFGGLDAPRQIAHDEPRRLVLRSLIFTLLLVLNRSSSGNTPAQLLINLTVTGLRILDPNLLAVKVGIVQLLKGTLGILEVGECNETEALGNLGLWVHNDSGVLDHIGL